ncbi:MAG: 23S rRNA (pseudouridine(1915)-N(3))-methyltransferase RlmH [Robiginitomaculum sp.]
MKITVRASGLIKSGPERALIDDYLSRAKHLSRNLGITDISVSAIDTRGAKSRADETRAILSGYDNARIIALDERGKALTSRQISRHISRWRDDGDRHIVFVIGGADGFEPSELPANVTLWSFGPQVWPHKLVRVMIMEQIYRALSILAGTPYHRD